HYASVDGSALAGTDYSAVSGTLTFGPGQTVQNVVVPILDLAGDAPARTFTIALSNPHNATLVHDTATITIPPSGATPVGSPKISTPTNMTVGETDGYVDLPVTLNAPGLKTVTVNDATVNGTGVSGTACNARYVGVSGTLTFTPGQTVQVVR